MRILLIGVLFLSFWTGVAGQDLPFEINILDLNTDTDVYGIQQVSSTPSGFVLTHSNGCAYRGNLDGTAQKIGCTTREYHIIDQNSQGTLLQTILPTRDSSKIEFVPHELNLPALTLLTVEFTSAVSSVVVNNKILFGERGKVFTTDGTLEGTSLIDISFAIPNSRIDVSTISMVIKLRISTRFG